MSNNPTTKPEWQDLKEHRDKLGELSMRGLFDTDRKRFGYFSRNIDGLIFDFSKHCITKETFDLLINLAKAFDIETQRDKMFSGERINATEDRSVLHMALRAPEHNNSSAHTYVQDILQRIKSFSKDIRTGTWTGVTGKPIRHIVNIGMGGSDLGPRMVCEALQDFQKEGIQTHFVTNIDADDLLNTLGIIEPESTLFIVASKSFTTQETMVNASSARAWLAEQLKTDNVSRHFVGITNNTNKAVEFGIRSELIFPLEDWIGGRFSLWSAIGLSIAISVGFSNFEKLLKGAHTIDEHFQSSPLEKNIPIIMALLGIWYRNFWDAETLAVMPYAQNLSSLPAYLQQLSMESNGKNVDKDGHIITSYKTAPIVFGQPGSNGQHAFFQLLHQGTALIPCDFIGFIQPNHSQLDNHMLLLNNMLAQSQALMQGRTSEEADSCTHKTFMGNRPSSTFLYDRLDPYHLGMLIALYEHKTFVEGVIWNINSFDQFGVELGKELAKNIENKEQEKLDHSTRGLLDHIHAKLKT